MPEETRLRLKKVISLLRNYPEGLSTPEIARHLDVTRQTALADINRLSREGVPIYEDGSRYALDPHFQNQLSLSRAEAWMLYLPLRRMVRAHMNRIPIVRDLLYQVTSLLNQDMVAPLLEHDEAISDESEVLDTVFTDLVACWFEYRLAQITYRRPNASRPNTLVVQVWWFEPAVWSDASYVVGGLVGRDQQVEPVTLKIDRIQAVTMLDDRFDAPDQDVVLSAINQTWGIWLAEEQPVTVRLRFHNRQLDRLRETIWHATQRLTVQDDGSILWEAEIAEPQEMLPWIRGWGADVEVLEPEHIRQHVASDAEAAARLYGRLSSDEPSYF